MKNKKSADIVLVSKGYFPLVAFFLMLFLTMLISLIYTYIIVGKSVGFAFFSLILLITIFGGIAIFIYSLYGSKVLVYGDTIAIRKWYGARREFNIKHITELVLEKSENKVVSIQIITIDSKDKFFDDKLNFDTLKDYLIDNLDGDRIKCYILGTKKETTI